MGTLLATVATETALTEAWQDLLANDEADGQLTVGTRRFAADAPAEIARMAVELAEGTYRPRPLAWVVIPKSSGGSRDLHIPPVRDRIVEKAIATVLTPIIDPLLGPASFAYRPGLGVADAVQRVARLRDEGLAWAVRTDIDDCFPTIDTARLRRLLQVMVSDTDLLAIIDALLTRPVRDAPARHRLRGLAQGSPLSPILVNLALEQVDDTVRAAGFPLVRYSDDLAILASGRDEAWEALRVAADAAKEIAMSLGEDKTAIMSFEEGFCFLGEDFGPRYPPVVDTHRIVGPAAKTVYVGMPGAGVRTEAGRIVVESPDDAELLSVPSGHVERLVLFGPVGLSAGARSWALTNQVEVILASRRGGYLGQLSGDGTRRVHRLRAQLAAADDPIRAAVLGRAIVAAKVGKQIVLLQRQTRRGPHETLTHAIAAMRTLVGMLPDATTRDEIMGVEGAAAREYFTALGALMPEPLRFDGRSRRPPLDVVNAALSLGYTILCGEAVAALAAAGLDPAIGVLHALADRRPSLALDLMEEFRPLVVDQVVVEAVNSGRLKPEHGRVDEGRAGVLLTKAGRRAIVDGYERRMLRTTRGALAGFAGSWRRHLYRQAQVMAAWVDTDTPWTGLSWR
ncbi:MAG: CRISPR-associated endonuclease Cas1 [Micromonosporaceae bacterium]|nr:CRISPR-associated endonuclease Cas1 [Micromonosporaceae bacterium]